MITYEEKDNMLGVQVVLLDNCTWKLSVVKENKERASWNVVQQAGCRRVTTAERACWLLTRVDGGW